MANHAQAEPDDLDDAELIAAIAKSRNQRAFEELMRRYERNAFGLALRITAHRESAEEAVQEAMLNIWTSAPTFRGEGSVKSWLLTIVAGEAIRTLKAAKRKSIQMEIEKSRSERLHTGSTPLEGAESSELTAGLQRTVDALPALDRQLIALHFGGGLSQQEISDALSIPQQTISYRMNVTLKTLKSQLSAAGYAAAIPMLSAKGFRDIFSEGIDVPGGLREKVLSKLAGRKSFRTNRGVRRTAAQSSGGLAVAGGVTVALVVAGALWVVFSNPSSKAAPSPTQKSPVTAVAAPDDTPAVWRRRWTFENGPPDDLIVVSGKWTWNKEAQAMVMENDTDIRPTHLLQDVPLMITAICRGLDITRKTNGGILLQKNNREIQTNVIWNRPSQLISGFDMVQKCYLYHRRLVSVVNDEPRTIGDNDDDPKGAAVFFRFGNLSIRELSVTPLTEDEVPDFVKHPEQIMKK